MTRGAAVFHVGVLLALFICTPLMSYHFGPKAGAVTGAALFLLFCFGPRGK